MVNIGLLVPVGAQIPIWPLTLCCFLQVCQPPLGLLLVIEVQMQWDPHLPERHSHTENM